MIDEPADQPTPQTAEPATPADPPEQPAREDGEKAAAADDEAALHTATAARSKLKARLQGPIAKLRAAQKEAAVHERAAQRASAMLERERAWTAKLERAREAWTAKLARVRGELRAAQKEAAVHERAARRASAKHEREREAWTAKLAHVRGELNELRKSYHLSGVAKKLDLRQMDGFSEIASEIVTAGRTGMNYDRLYTLWQAIRAAPQDESVIEIGSYRGGSARFISQALLADGRMPRFYVCDTFAGHPQTDTASDTSLPDSANFKDTSAEATADYLEGYPALVLVVGDIVETGPRLEEDYFGFVHLDVNLYPATLFCLRFFAPRLAGGAMMVIDDYGVVTCPGVKQAADEFVAEFPQFRLWHLLTGQAILWRVAPDP